MKLQNQPKCQSIDESIKKTEYTCIVYLKERSHKDQGDGSVSKVHVSLYGLESQTPESVQTQTKRHTELQ